MQKTTFTGADIAHCIKVSLPDQNYWIGKGYLIADVQDKSPRTISAYQATAAGFIQFFRDHDFSLPTSARLAHIVTAILADAHGAIDAEEGKGNVVGHLEKLTVQNGVLAMMKTDIGSASSKMEDGAIKMHFHEGASGSKAYSFLAQDVPNLDEYMRRPVESEAVYHVGKVAQRIWRTLNLDISALSKAPKDSRVIFKEPTATDEGIIVGIVGDRYLK